MTAAFRSLSTRNYRLYFLGALVSNTGTWMQRVAQDWLVLQLAGTGTAVGITTGLQFLPMLLFGLWGGVIADRMPKRRLLVCTQAFMGMQALVLGVLVVTGAVEVWHVYALAFMLGVGTALDNPARQSFVVELVGRDDVTNAVGLNSAAFNSARLVGPAISGLLIAAIGTGSVFLINAASYLAVIGALLAMRDRELHSQPRVAREPGQLREALRYVAGRPDLLAPIVIIFVVGTFGMNFQLTLSLFAKYVFHRQADAFGLLSSLMAVGTLAGALTAAARRRPRLRLVVGAALAFSLLETLTALMPTYWAFAAMLVPTGAAALTMTTAANASLQLGASPEMRGRVMALYITVFLGSTPFGGPLIGWLAETFGTRWSLLFGSLVSLTGTAVAAAVLARRRGMLRLHVRPRPG